MSAFRLVDRTSKIYAVELLVAVIIAAVAWVLNSAAVPMTRASIAAPVGVIHRGDNAPQGIIHVYGDITSDTTWTSGNIYVVHGYRTVSSGITLTIQAGTIVKFDWGYLDVFGTLNLTGTVGNEVVFTSYRDDSYGGDTNGDGNNTTPAPGDWDAVYLENGNTTFSYAIVRYAYYGLSVWNDYRR